MRTLIALLITVCGWPGAWAQGAVHVVDPAGGPYALHNAVNGAASGDVVLVREGNYDLSTVEIRGKSLTLVAEPGASVRSSTVEVSQLGPADQVLVRGLTMAPLGLSASVFDNDGSVWFEDCAFHPQGSLGSGGLAAGASRAVVLSSCSVLPPPFSSLSPQLVVGDSSHAYLFSSDVLGLIGTGAVQVTDASLDLFGSRVAGGDGCGIGLGAGDGLVLAGASAALVLDSTISGGSGGGVCGSGEALVLQGGSATFLSGTARGYQVSAPVRDDELVSATITGKPGDGVWIRFSARPGPGTGSPLTVGEFLLGAPVQGFLAGVVPSSGVLVVSRPAPTLAPGVQSTVIFSQAIVRDGSSGRFFVSAPSALVVVDDVF